MSRKLSHREAAKIYKVLATTLCTRIVGRPFCSDSRPVVQKLTELEKETIV